MPSVTIPNDVYERLAMRAAALGIGVEQLIPLLEHSSESSGNRRAPSTELSIEEWKKGFEAWMKEVQARAHRYPPGFVLDDSRESIYEGCGE